MRHNRRIKIKLKKAMNLGYLDPYIRYLKRSLEAMKNKLNKSTHVHNKMRHNVIIAYGAQEKIDFMKICLDEKLNAGSAGLMTDIIDFYIEKYPNYPEQLDKLVEVMIATVDAVPVGIAISFNKILMLYVKPDYRFNGIGRQLAFAFKAHVGKHFDRYFTVNPVDEEDTSFLTSLPFVNISNFPSVSKTCMIEPFVENKELEHHYV